MAPLKWLPRIPALQSHHMSALYLSLYLLCICSLYLFFVCIYLCIFCIFVCIYFVFIFYTGCPKKYLSEILGSEIHMKNLDRFGPCHIILDTSENFGAFLHFELFWTLLDQSGPFWTISDRLDRFGLFGPIGLFWTVLDCLDCLDRFGPFWTVLDCLDRLMMRVVMITTMDDDDN